MVLVPISKVVLAAADQANVALRRVLHAHVMHELMHGLGPHDITVGGRATTVRQELKETYSAIEEAKADISGLFALQYLIDKGVVDKALETTMYTTFLASAFRSIRFGVNEAHGRGIAIQLNYLLDDGAFIVASRRHVRGEPGEDQGRRGRADARHHDACRPKATTRRPRTIIDAARHRPAGGAAGARQADRRCRWTSSRASRRRRSWRSSTGGRR